MEVYIFWEEQKNKPTRKPDLRTPHKTTVIMPMSYKHEYSDTEYTQYIYWVYWIYWIYWVYWIDNSKWFCEYSQYLSI